MPIEHEAFRRKKPDFDRLALMGFTRNGDAYHYAETFMDGAFRAEVRITVGGEILGRVIERDTGEEYLPLRAAEHRGTFVGEVREQYRAILDKIAAACCIDQPFLHVQANRIAALIARRHGERPDFPFSGRYSDCAVFRHPENRKWYGIIMGIARSKLPTKPPDSGPSGLEALAPDAEIEVMNLKANPNAIPRLVREPGIFPCYHMNRKHWVSLALEDILPDERVLRLVEDSREATLPRNRRRNA